MDYPLTPAQRAQIEEALTTAVQNYDSMGWHTGQLSAALDLVQSLPPESAAMQQPVAWMRDDGRPEIWTAKDKERAAKLTGQWQEAARHFTIPLYAAPSLQQPLSDEQIEREWMLWNLPADSADAMAFYRLGEQQRIRKAFEDGLRRGAALQHQPAAPDASGGKENEQRPMGCVLAMRVMQSDLYQQLDDTERADCDELVQRNLAWFKGSAALQHQPAAPDASGGKGD